MYWWSQKPNSSWHINIFSGRYWVLLTPDSMSVHLRWNVPVWTNLCGIDPNLFCIRSPPAVALNYLTNVPPKKVAVRLRQTAVKNPNELPIKTNPKVQKAGPVESFRNPRLRFLFTRVLKQVLGTQHTTDGRENDRNVWKFQCTPTGTAAILEASTAGGSVHLEERHDVFFLPKLYWQNVIAIQKNTRIKKGQQIK